MADARHSFETLARHLIKAAAPLVAAGASVGEYRRLMSRLGFKVANIPAPMASLSVTAGSAQLKISASGAAADLIALVDAAKGIYDGIHALAAGPAPAGVDPGVYAAEIGQGLFDLLLTEYLSTEFRPAYNFLNAVGIIDIQPVGGTPSRPGFLRPSFKWPEFAKLITDPSGIPARVFKWGTPDFDGSLLVERLIGFFGGLNFPVALQEPDPDALRGYLGVTAELASASRDSFHLPFFYKHYFGTGMEASFNLRPLGAHGGKLPGIVIEPRFPAAFPLELKLHPKVSVRLRAGTNGADLWGIAIQPGDVNIRYPFKPGTPPPAAGFGVGFDFASDGPTLLVGSPQGTRLEFNGASLDLSANITSGKTDVAVAAEMKDLALVISGDGEGLFDGFLKKIMGDGPSRVTIPLGLEWTGAHGIRFEGSGGFDVQVHPHLTLGAIRIDDVDVRLQVLLGGSGATRLDLAATVAGSLGPFDFFVHGIGLYAEAKFTNGNFGPLDVRLGFLPPSGVGLSMDVGGFKGGGFLILDTANGEYDGGIELDFKGIVTVKAVGLLSTKFPDGHSGYSLLILISAEFPPIQLGLGFTLLGVGGLIGLSRTVDEDALREGVHQGALDSVLFPRDIVANAPRIVSDLQRLFPPMEDHFLVGPMVKFGWGTPTILSLEFGIILDIPRPGFLILGRLRVGLPFQDLPLFDVRVAFAGGVDFELGQFWLDGTLHDSRLLTFPLTGDMAIRLYWGADANFILTVGGFHPAYVPPPMGLGNLQRLGITIFQGNPRLRAEAYFAITSNTVQFGAKAELYFGVDVFNVYGFIALDVLIQFDPFHFIATLTATLAVRSGSDTLFAIRVDALLEGPAPWHARGTGHFEISFIITIEIDAGFEITWGGAQKDTVLPIAVLPMLVAALGDSRNWRAVFPAGTNAQVTLRAADPNQVEDKIVVHPFGSLEISEKVVPLDFPIQKVGTQKTSDGQVFSLDSVTLSGAPADDLELTKGQFAVGQFVDMDDARKLSSRPFDTFDTGVRFGGGNDVAADYFTRMTLSYEVVYVPEHRKRVFFDIAAILFDAFTQLAEIAKSALSNSKSKPSPLGTGKIRYSPEQFAVTSTINLTLHSETSVYATEAAAHAAMTAIVDRDPSMREEIQVVPVSLARAA